VFTAALWLAAGAVALAVAPLGPAADAVPWATLPVLALLLLAATWFVVPFRYGESVDATNLVEAVLAPLLFIFPPVAVVAVAATSQVVNGVLRRLPVVKTVFNTGMWALAAGVGGAIMAQVAGGPLWPDRIAGLVAALGAVGLVNALAFAIVLSLVEGEGVRHLLSRLTPVVDVGWVGSWAVNAAFGLLFALAIISWPPAVVVFGVPMLVLHLAYRSYAAARADQIRLAAAHRAARRLAEPLDPMAGVAAFLGELAEAFHAAAAELVLPTDTGRRIHRVERTDSRLTVRDEAADAGSLAGALAASAGPVDVSALHDGPIAGRLAAAGVTNCLAAPLLDGDAGGAVIVLDRGGFEGSRAAELAIFESLAREVTGALVRGRLLDDMLDERRKLAAIVDSASDGICSLAADGTVLTWNPALEQLTGLAAADVVGRADFPGRLHLRTADGRRIDLAQPRETLPRDVLLTTVDGRNRHLTCSYSAAAGVDGPALVVVARDVTPAQEHEALRQRFSLLVRADAARRAMVDQLQQAVVPAPVVVPGAKLAAAYQASDPRAPTGGDLYDWQVLPSGELHVAVVDVLGHGVAATKDALAVVHTLRVVIASGAPLETVVARADELLRAQHPDLVATVIVARYNPMTGGLRVAAGGHPPALVVSARGRVVQVPASGGVIGWPGAGSDEVAQTQLQPGDALVLYTDGLIEARKDILDGMERLMRHAADVADLPALRLAEELVARALAGAERRDDTLALVLRRDPMPSVPVRASWTLTPEASDASAVRRRLRVWLTEQRVAPEDVVAVAGELLANAIRAARSLVTLSIDVDPGRIRVEVSDDGRASSGLELEGLVLPGDASEQGRGLFLVRALCEQVEVLATPEGSTVCAVLARRHPEGQRPPTATVRHPVASPD
jgi:PAS domain S-box-containing protein